MHFNPFARGCALTAAVCALAAAGLPRATAQETFSGTVEIQAEAPAIVPDPTAGRSRVDSVQIEASGADSAAAVVALAPGVSISENGGQGAQASVSIRGSTTNQVLVLVDGVPASDPSTGQVDFAKLGLAPSDIESVEVLRGGASTQYGPDAVGGVVLVTTKKAKAAKAPSLELSLSNLSRMPFASVSGYGNGASDVSPNPLALLDAQEFSARLDTPWGLAAGAGFERAQNGFLFYDTSGVKRTRGNNDLLGGRASLSWSGAVAGGRLASALEADLRELGVPGSVSAPTPDARERDRDARASLAWSTDSFISDSAAFDGKLYGVLKDVHYEETSGAAGDQNTSSRAGLDGRWSILLSPALSLGLGVSSRYERLDSSNVANSSGGVPERLSAGGYLEPTFSFGLWKLVPAARFDWTSDYPSGFSFSLGAARQISEELKLSANASTAYRAPSFDDLYWPAQAGVAGNPGLSPESSISGDLGLDLTRKSYSLSVSGFVRYIKDVILWQPGSSDGIWRPSNWGTALYPGIEASLKAALGGFDLGLSASVMHSYVLSGSLGLADDLRVPMVPEASFILSLSRALGPLSAGLSLDYAGLRYTGTDNIAYLPARLVVDAHLGFAPSGRLSYEIEAANLLNERYESVQGYPMPGFSLKATAKLRLEAPANAQGR